MQTTGSREYVCIIQPFVILIFSNVVQVMEGQSVKIMLGPIREEQKTGTYVGNIASATSISREVSQAEFSTLRFDFLDPSDKWTHLFSINGRSGALFTQTMIDREILCDDMKDCIIKFDVTVNSDVTDFLRLVEVSINVTDINDNMPAFDSDELTIDIPENNAVGVTKPLPSAVDKDKGDNSVQKYTLLSPSDPFTLKVERRLNNRFLLTLVVNSALDREKQDRYKLLLTATDGGQQALTGTLTVFVNVTDVNDNTPLLSQQHYSFSVGETAGVGDVLGKLSATDRDVGKNAEIRYSLIFQGKENRGRALFAIDQFTGEITIKAPLQYDAGKSFEAVVEAKDQGDMPRVSEATLMLSIVNMGNNAPRLEVKLQKTVFENTVLIPEDAKNSTFVGKLTAVDNDPGASGNVTCSSRHPSFRTDHVGGYYAIIMNGSLDREVAEKIDVSLVCRDSGSPPKTSSITFQVIVSDINDNAPVFSQTQYIANVTEENIVGKQILQLTAEDPDAGINKMFTYSLFPKENSVFSIDKDSGILKARTTFDHEVEKRLNVIILATDEGHPSLVSTATVIVNILDINDNYPELVTRELRVAEGGGRMKFVGKLEGSDKDSGLNSEMVFSMPPTDDITSQMFKVNPNGVVIAIQELDRESRDKYILHLEVRDKGLDPKMTSGTVAVIVEDINDHAPVFQYPNEKNHTVTILWSMPVNKEITRMLATDRDLGDNKKISYSIVAGNRGDLFGLDQTSGTLFLQRRIKDTDGYEHRLLISARDGGHDPRETQADKFVVIIDATNATFSAVGHSRGDEKYILLAGIIAGLTLLFSVIVLLVIFLIRRGNGRRPSSPVDKHAEWQVVKTGIQEECGKGEVEKINWRGSDIDADVKDSEESGIGRNYIPHSPPDVTKTGSYDTIKKTADGCPPWSSARDGVVAGQSEAGLGVDPYRKQDFYTFCKVRVNPHDDVNSVTSGETTTSDSGRGGSEDDIPLPPIVECSPELYSNHSSPKQEVEYRPITSVPSNSMSRQPMKADFKTMPSLSSFRNPDVKLYPVKSSFHPLGEYSPNSHTYHGHKNDKHDYSPRSGTAYTSLTQVPQSKTIGPSRHVTFLSNQDRLAQSQKEEKIQEQNRRSPFPSGYENLVPELGGLYVSLPRIGDDDDGNTTTSGSYTIDSDHLNDSIISA